MVAVVLMKSDVFIVEDPQQFLDLLADPEYVTTQEFLLQADAEAAVELISVYL